MRRGHVWLWVALFAALLGASRADAQYLFYADTNFPAPALHRCGPAGAGLVTRALDAGTLPEGLAYDEVHHQLFWAEACYSGARIRVTDSGLGAGTTILSGLGSVRGLAVDATNDWLYWTSSDQAWGATIGRAHLDGTGAEILFILYGFNPRQITVDSAHGKVYWTEFELDAIVRCNLNGSEGEFFAYLLAGSRPYGIGVDTAANELWWSEYATGVVQKLLLPPAPAAMGQLAARPADGGVATRSSALIAAARERSAAIGAAREVSAKLAAQAAVIAFVNPTYLALDPSGQQLFVTQAGVGATAVRRANFDGSGLSTLPVTENSFGGVVWFGGSLLDVPGGEGPPHAGVALALRVENPARGGASVEFGLPGEGDVRLDVLDAAGRRVATLTQGRHAAGVHRLTWTGETGAGRAAPGMYVMRLEAGGRSLTRRFAYLK